MAGRQPQHTSAARVLSRAASQRPLHRASGDCSAGGARGGRQSRRTAQRRDAGVGSQVIIPPYLLMCLCTRAVRLCIVHTRARCLDPGCACVGGVSVASSPPERAPRPRPVQAPAAACHVCVPAPFHTRARRCNSATSLLQCSRASCAARESARRASAVASASTILRRGCESAPAPRVARPVRSASRDAGAPAPRCVARVAHRRSRVTCFGM